MHEKLLFLQSRRFWVGTVAVIGNWLQKPDLFAPDALAELLIYEAMLFIGVRTWDRGFEKLAEARKTDIANIVFAEEKSSDK